MPLKGLEDDEAIGRGAEEGVEGLFGDQGRLEATGVSWSHGGGEEGGGARMGEERNRRRVFEGIGIG